MSYKSVVCADFLKELPNANRRCFFCILFWKYHEHTSLELFSEFRPFNTFLVNFSFLVSEDVWLFLDFPSQGCISELFSEGIKTMRR